MLEAVTKVDRLYTPQLDDLGHDTRSDFPLLKRAPITEGLIDIRVSLPSDIELGQLEAFQEPIRRRFKQRFERHSTAAELRVGEAGLELKPTQNAHPDGYIYRADDEGLIVQARLDGFTISKVQQYVSWEHLRSNAAELWKTYLDVARPKVVTRLAVRYINRLDLPLGEEMKTCIGTVPEVAAGIPQSIAEYAMRIVLPHPSGAIAIVNQSSLKPDPAGKSFPILFDIDVFRVVELRPDTDEIWSQLQELRVYKNRIFFNSLTPKMLEGYR